jgi:hypothetical protein
MAEITRFPFVSYLRSERSVHVVKSRNGKTIATGRGLSFWFQRMGCSVSEVPRDDRDLPVLFQGRTRDFQQVTTQAVVSWRVTDPEKLADRIDFCIDLTTGAWTQQPLEQVAGLLTQLSQQVAWGYLAHIDVGDALATGVSKLQERIEQAMTRAQVLTDMGIEVVAVRVASVRPTADVEKALQMPTREAIQQRADSATYERRAAAVQRERAVAENELQNKIELAKREKLLIAQRGANMLSQAQNATAVERVQAEADAAVASIAAASEAESIRLVEQAKTNAERERIEIYRELPQSVMIGLAARDAAAHLPDIGHLTVSPELIGPALARLAERTG